ncbi:MAG: NAD-dependent epimerase [Deltaproteobacteria bacterium]|nr:NAD-dependent epimerase [Deltaproteobacteria bacterium]
MPANPSSALGASTILVTGAAGFIGFFVAKVLLSKGFQVVGLDNMSPYYDLKLKADRLEILTSTYKNQFQFVKVDIADRENLKAVFEKHRPRKVIHLAAQAGVRYSITNPEVYVQSNLVGFANILEGVRQTSCEHLIYASTSSVYGASTKIPFSVHEDADHPVSLYGATKRANELMAHSYSMMFQIPTTGLRFFTVYGPWGRPDMALFLFTKNILENKPIDVFNHGDHKRDFTYIDDIVEGIVSIAIGDAPQENPNWNSKTSDPATSSAPYRIYNIGNNRSEPLNRYIEVIEEVLQKKATKNFLPLQKGDVPETHANIDDLVSDYGFKPKTRIEVGVKNFVQWYRDYYKV